MYWRARYISRRVRLSTARVVARTRLGTLVRGLFPLYFVIGLALAVLLRTPADPSSVEALWQQAGAGVHAWAERGEEVVRERVTPEWSVQAARALFELVLPPVPGNGTGPEPPGSWRTPMRALLHVATGYDFSQPRSFLEAVVPGFGDAVLRAGEGLRGVDRGVALRGVPGSEAGAGSSRTPQAAPGAGVSGSLPGGAPGQAGGAPGAAGAGGPGVETGPAPGADLVDSASPAAGEGVVPALPVELASLARIPWGREPLVLIVHSHTSESYARNPPDPRADAKHHVYNSSDTGITRVGEVLARTLEERYNIPTIHSKRVHNWPYHWDAYRNSRLTVQEYLKQYPSIRLVLDVHRQGVDGLLYATTVGGVDAVGVDIIYTTAQTFDYAAHPNWRENQRTADLLGRAMEELHPGLLRRIMRVDDSRYNQDLHPHMLLLEVGNYLDLEEHALEAARLLADPVAKLLAEIAVGPDGTIPGSTRGRSADALVAPPAPPKPSPVARSLAASLARR